MESLSNRERELVALVLEQVIALGETLVEGLLLAGSGEALEAGVAVAGKRLHVGDVEVEPQVAVEVGRPSRKQPGDRFVMPL